MSSFVLIASLCLPAWAADEPEAQTETSPLSLLEKAYKQIHEKDFGGATRTLCGSIKSGDSIAARRYLSYTLLQRKCPQEALEQLKSMQEPIAFDLFMKGIALEMTGELDKAAQQFQAAVEKEPKNDFFRMKAIKMLITLSKYDDAAKLSADGKAHGDAKSRSIYERQEKQAEYLSACIAKNRPCVMPHK